MFYFITGALIVVSFAVGYFFTLGINKRLDD